MTIKLMESIFVRHVELELPPRDKYWQAYLNYISTENLLKA